MVNLIILFFALACATVICAQPKDPKGAPNQYQEMIQKFGPRPSHSSGEKEDSAIAEHKAPQPKRRPHGPLPSSGEVEGSASDEHRPRPPHRPPHGPPHSSEEAEGSASDEHRPRPPHRPPHRPSTTEEPETTTSDNESETTAQ